MAVKRAAAVNRSSRLLEIPLRSYRRSSPSLGTLTTIRSKNGRTGLLQYNSPLEPSPPPLKSPLAGMLDTRPAPVIREAYCSKESTSPLAMTA